MYSVLCCSSIMEACCIMTAQTQAMLSPSLSASWLISRSAPHPHPTPLLLHHHCDFFLPLSWSSFSSSIFLQWNCRLWFSFSAATVLLFQDFSDIRFLSLVWSERDGTRRCVCVCLWKHTYTSAVLCLRVDYDISSKKSNKLGTTRAGLSCCAPG